MKKILIALFVFPLLFSSCVVGSYYQTYNVSSENVNKSKTGAYVYEDDNCIILYDFWSNGGDSGFEIYNKTDTDLIVQKDACFFIYNGYANNYYKNREYTNSESNSALISKSITGISYRSYLQTTYASVSKAAGLSTTQGYSVSVKEEEKIIIPPKSSKLFYEYDLINYPKRHCELPKYPSSQNTKDVNFDINNSPIKFNNRIVYKIEGNAVRVENKFFVSKMSNIPRAIMVQRRRKSLCGNTLDSREDYFAIGDKPDMFYIKYQNSDTQEFGEVIND